MSLLIKSIPLFAYKKEEDIGDPEGCVQEYKDICDGCSFCSSVEVSHPGGGMSTVPKYSCDLGYWEEDF